MQPFQKRKKKTQKILTEKIVTTDFQTNFITDIYQTPIRSPKVSLSPSHTISPIPHLAHPGFEHLLPFNKKIVIFSDFLLKVFDSAEKEIFSESYFAPRAGQRSGKAAQPFKISRMGDRIAFLTQQNTVCLLDSSQPEMHVEYFGEGDKKLVDLVIDDEEQRIVVLNKAGTLFYKSFSSKVINEDSTLATDLGKRARAMGISPDGQFLVVGCEIRTPGVCEDHIFIFSKNSQNKLFDYLSSNFVASSVGKLLFYFRYGS